MPRCLPQEHPINSSNWLNRTEYCISSNILTFIDSVTCCVLTFQQKHHSITVLTEPFFSFCSVYSGGEKMYHAILAPIFKTARTNLTSIIHSAFHLSLPSSLSISIPPFATIGPLSSSSPPLTGKSVALPGGYDNTRQES